LGTDLAFVITPEFGVVGGSQEVLLVGAGEDNDSLGILIYGNKAGRED
jgi:hypothetical protein